MEHKVHRCVYKSPLAVLIPSQINEATPSQPISLRSILMLSSRLGLGIPSGLFPSGLPTKFLPPVCARCPDHLIILVYTRMTKKLN
jgi:hypothetical protein